MLLHIEDLFIQEQKGGDTTAQIAFQAHRHFIENTSG